MAKKAININGSATQFVADINTNIGIVGGEESVSVNDSASTLVNTLNGVFDGVSGAEELSVDDNAADFVDAINDNFDAASSGGGQAREFEDLIVLPSPNANTSEMVPDYMGEKFYLLDKNTNNLERVSNTSHFEFYDENKSNPASVHNVNDVCSPQNGFMTIGNSVLKASTLKDAGIMVTKSRTRNYINPKYRWVLFGDSITALHYSKTLGKDLNAGYPWFIGEECREIAIENNAVSGTGIDVKTGNVLSRVQSTDFTPYDLCSIFIGTNDYTYGKTKETLKTAYRTVLDIILTSKPTIKIFICTLIERADRSIDSRFYELSDGIRDIGVEYNIPVLDLGRDCGLDLRRTDHQNLYCRIVDGVPDKLHPSQEAHEIFLVPLFKAMLVNVLNDSSIFPGVEPYQEHEWTIGDSYTPNSNQS